MNDPKTLQIIAEKACQFDRAHFDDDEPTVVDSLLANRERLPTDRKLITRLRPRYAVALGFFEGYTLAIEDNDELRRERDELQTKLAEAERTGAEHAAQLENEIRTLVAERDRYKREMMESKNATPANADVYAWVMQSKYVPFFETGFGPADLANALNDFRREFAIPTDPKNIGIVIKPPPPPPAAPPAPNELRTEIDDELAQAAANHANKVHGYGSVHDDSKQAREALTYDNPVGWAIPVQSFVYGAQWQLSRIENAHAGDDPTMHLPPAFDRAPMPSDREIAELVCRAIYTWHKYTDDDIEHVVNVLNCEREDLRRKIGMFSGSTAEACAVKFALLHFRDRLVGPANEVQNAELEKQSAPGPIVFRDLVEVCFWDKHTHVLASKPNTTSQSVATAADEMIEERRKRLPSVATSNVVQRAMAVADLLRKQGMHVAAVNRIVDGKSRSAIAFGHEQTTLVFVDRPRHDRMQTEDVADEVVDSYELSRQHVVDLPAESDEIVGLTNRIVDLEDTIEWVQKRLAKMLGREDLPLVGESLDAIEIAIAPKEYDDELLLEAASFANASERFTSPNDRLPKSKELEHAKKAIREDHTSTWYRVCRAYVNGALRSSRNP